MILNSKLLFKNYSKIIFILSIFLLIGCTLSIPLQENENENSISQKFQNLSISFNCYSEPKSIILINNNTTLINLNNLTLKIFPLKNKETLNVFQFKEINEDYFLPQNKSFTLLLLPPIPMLASKNSRGEKGEINKYSWFWIMEDTLTKESEIILLMNSEEITRTKCISSN